MLELNMKRLEQAAVQQKGLGLYTPCQGEFLPLTYVWVDFVGYIPGIILDRIYKDENKQIPLYVVLTIKGQWLYSREQIVLMLPSEKEELMNV